MNMLLKKLLSRYMAPAGEDGTDTGGTDTGSEDRGDDFTPTGDDEAGEGADDGQSAGAGEDGAGEDAAGAGDGGQSAADGADEPEDERGQRSPGIPKGRFNEVNERRKELESENERLKRELAEARAAQPAAPAAAHVATAAQPEVAVFDVAAKEQEYADALIEGDTGKAAMIRGEINSHLIEQATQQAEGNIARRSAQQLLQAEVEVTLKTYPWLDTPDGAEALDLILAARDRAISQGVAPHQALRSAVAKIAPRFKPTEDDDTPSGDLSGSTKGVDTRSSEAVRRGAADAVAQPPAMQVGVGNRATPASRVDVTAMDDEQFAALSPAEKSRLRGD